MNITVLHGLMDKGIESLQEMKRRFDAINQDPEKILTDLFNPSLHQPYYGFPFMTIQCSAELLDGQKVSYHHLQDEWIAQVSAFLESKDAGIHVQRSSYNTYPAQMNIHFGQYSLLRFSFYNHTFEDARPKGDKLQDRVSKLQADVEEKERAIATWESYFENPPCTTWKDRLYYSWYKLSLEEAWRAKIRRESELLENDQNFLESAQDELDAFLERKDEMDEKYEFWKSYFLILGYQEKSRESMERSTANDTH